MKKMQLVGIGHDVGRSYFVFPKDELIFSTLPLLLDKLGLPKTGSLYDPVDPASLIDLVENTRNATHDVDLFFGKDRINLVVRTDERNRGALIEAVKAVADFKGFE